VVPPPSCAWTSPCQTLASISPSRTMLRSRRTPANRGARSRIWMRLSTIGECCTWCSIDATLPDGRLPRSEISC
jgi:hypothetical protein